MFIRFESDGLKCPRQCTVECNEYTTWEADGGINVQLDNLYVHFLDDSKDNWNRAYVMNSQGRTVDTILPHGPKG